MIKMDQKAQVSAEFVIIVGFILVLVLIFASYVGEQSELNSVAASARSGAMDAASEIVFLNKSIEPVRVTTVSIVGDSNKTIQIRLSASLPANCKEFILNRTLESIAAQGYARQNNTIVTERYVYNVTIL